MNRSILLILLVSTSSFANDPFACVNPDVANAFLGQWQRDLPSYSTSIPDEFVRFNAPASLTLVGSQIEANMTTVVFGTSLDVEDALSASAAAMVDAGWSEKIDERATARRGFQAVQRSTAPVFCHDNQPGAVSVIAKKKTGQTLVSFVHHTEPVSRSCDEPAPVPPRHDPRELIALLPMLKLPEGATATNMGTGGNGDEVNTRVDVSSAFGQSDLISLFGDQIRDQGWVFETGWSGSFSSGTVWTLDTPDDGILIGKLHVYGSNTDPVRVRFSINPIAPAKNTYNGSWSSTTIQSN